MTPDAMAEAVVAAIASVPAVRIDGSTGAGTFLAGRMIPGVRVDDARVELHLVVRYPCSVRSAVTDVRRALTGTVDRRLDVVVTDLDPLSTDPAAPQAGSPSGATALVAT